MQGSCSAPTLASTPLSNLSTITSSLTAGLGCVSLSFSLSLRSWVNFCLLKSFDFLVFQGWSDVKLTSPQLSRETVYKLSLKNLTLESVSSR